MVDKLLERFLLDRFLSTLDYSIGGRIIPGEKPDFIIQRKPSCIGVEVTRYLVQPEPGEHPKKEQESLRDQVLELASEEFSRQDNRLVHVNVLFSSSKTIYKRNIHSIANDIVTIVCKFDVELGSFETIQTLGRSQFNLPDEVISITVARSRNLSRSYWNANDVGFIPECGINDIQMILNQKESKVEKYREICPNIWLLIVASGFGLSSYSDFPEEIFSQRYSSSFDRIFLFVNQQLASWELQH